MKTSLSRCEICRRNRATIFAVMHQAELVEKAHVCPNCFHALQQIDLVTTRKVGFGQFHETLTTTLLQRN